MSPEATPKQFASLTKKYGCIIADPPWMETGGGKIKRGADRHYPLMKLPEICALPVTEIAAQDSHLYLWITNNFLAQGAHVQVAKAWGFRPVTVLTWRKLGRIGLGQYFRGTTEHVVFCVRGAPAYKTAENGKRAQGVTDFDDDSPTSGLSFAELTLIQKGAWWEESRPGRHSKKPPKIHEWAELVSHGPYLEMFARTVREGWDAWGNEAPPSTDTGTGSEDLSLEDVING